MLELALRGHHGVSKESNDPGIFRLLIDFGVELNIVLKNDLDKLTVFREASKAIQSELLQIMLVVMKEFQMKLNKQIFWLLLLMKLMTCLICSKYLLSIST